MARADSGGFDLGLHLALDGLRDRIQAALDLDLPDVSFPIPVLDDPTLHPAFAITDVSVAPDATITITCSTAGATITWPEVFSGPFAEPGGTFPLTFELSIAATPTANGSALALTFAEHAATVTIAAGTLEAIPGIHAWLALLDLLYDDARVEQERQQLYDACTSGIAGLINGLLPDSVPLGALPSSLVTGVVFAGGNAHDLRILLTLKGGTPGLPAAVTRSPIRRTSSGAARDLAGIVVGNHCLLRTTLRPILEHGLGLPAAGFDGGHPCHWWGSTAMPQTAKVADLLPSITNVHGGIDDAGMITVSLGFSGEHSSHAFGITGGMQVGFGAAVIEQPPGAGGQPRRVLRLSVQTSVVTGLDIWVAGWAYAVGAVVAPLGALVAMFVDAFAGGELRGTINEAISSKLGDGTFDLPLPTGPIQAPLLSLAQPGPPQVWFSQVYGIPIADYPENDAIITFT